MKNKEHREIEEVYHVISAPPGWIQRHGLSVFALFLGVGLLISSLIRYPDDVEARIQLISETPAIRVYSLSRGELSKLFVSENQHVTKGERLALIKNSADINDVLVVDSLIRRFDFYNTEHYKFLQLEPKLGNLQPNYSTFLDRLNELKTFNQATNYVTRIQLLQNQLTDLKALQESMKKRRLILGEQLALANKDLDRNMKLYDGNVISEVDLETVTKELLRVKTQYQLLESSIIENKLNNSRTSAQLTELKAEYERATVTKKFDLQQSVSLLRAALENWKSVNLIYAPISGKVVFTNIRNESEFVTENLEVMAIEPLNKSSKIVGRTLLKGIGLGKIRVGMPVIIHLDSYPYHEFGSLVGSLKSIASVPNKEGYLIEVDLNNDLLTTYNTQIEFKHEMQGAAKIVTDDRSVLSRIFDRFKSLLEKGRSPKV